MVYQNTNFKICLSLFGCEVNILPKEHIVLCILCCCTFTSFKNCYFLLYSCRNLCKTRRNIANCLLGDFLQIDQQEIFLRIVHQDIFFKLFTERFLQIDHQEIYPAGRCDRASRQRLITLQKISALFEILTNFC